MKTIQFYLINHYHTWLHQEISDVVSYQIGQYVSLNGEDKSTHKIVSITHNLKKNKILIILEAI